MPSPPRRRTLGRPRPRRPASSRTGSAPPRSRTGRCRKSGGGIFVRRVVETVALARLRRYVVAHQGYAARARSARAAEVAAVVHRLGAVQLDSISTVDRAHRITIGSRAGAPAPGAEARLLRAGASPEHRAPQGV